MASTAAEFALFLEPKLSNIWHDAFPAVPSDFERVFNVRDMNKNTITDSKLAGFGPLETQQDGDEVTFDDPIAPVTNEYTYIVRAKGYKIHERLWLNDLYGEVEKFEADLRDAAKDDADTSAWSVFNNAFGTTNVGFDGLQLCSTAHTRLDGGATQANRPATDEPLSLSAIHNSIITSRKWVNDRGRPRVHVPDKLIVPLDLGITGRELLRSTLIPESANNTDNVVREWNLQLMEVHHLTSTTAWFMTSDKHDLNWFWRYRAQSDMDTEFKTDTVLRKIRQAYAFGFGEWRGVYGTDGVA